MKKLVLLILSAVFAPSLAQSQTTDANYISYDAYLNKTDIGKHKHQLSNVRSLFNQFRLLCADTLCEGRYGTIVPVRFYCSIEEASLQMGQCVWVFAAMEPQATPSDGSIVTDARVVECSFNPIADAEKFRDFMRRASFRGGVGSASGITRTGIPGLGKTLMDIVHECFAKADSEEL